MIIHIQWDNTWTAETTTAMEDFLLPEANTVLKPHFYPLLCQFLMKIITVITPVCTCIRISAEQEDFQRFLGWGVRMCVSNDFISFAGSHVLVCQV